MHFAVRAVVCFLQKVPPLPGERAADRSVLSEKAPEVCGAARPQRRVRRQDGSCVLNDDVTTTTATITTNAHLAALADVC